jgi:hypothetical protein
VDNRTFIIDYLKNIFEEFSIVNSSGGALIINVAEKCKNTIKLFIKMINNDYSSESLLPLKGLVKECGLSYTTLEEIFLKVIITI